jgi:pimeloyl-ACP methyl ester carboxylesterase
MRRSRVVTAFVLLIAVTACTDDKKATVATTEPTEVTTAPSGPGTTETGTVDDPFEWEDFDSDGLIQTGHLEVPINYDDPSQGTFDLYVARHLADPDQRIGTLLVNPGGPGFGGSDFAIYADQIYGEDLLTRFDILGWDPRGTGLSEPAIDCIEDYDHFYGTSDITPDDEAERTEIIDKAEEFATECVENNADIIEFIGTNNTAHDMDSIRQALGEEKISYFGFSYGSELGATWATLFPDTVRAAVLDGAADPNAGYVESSLQQAGGFEDSLQTFLDQCSADPECVFHGGGDAAAAFDALMLSLDESPVPSVDGRPDVSLQIAVTAVADAMYSDTMWPTLAAALAAAESGDGSGLLDLYDDYFGRFDDGTYGNELEAFQTIYCMDTEERLSVAEEDATVPQVLEVAPRLSPGTTGSYFCTFFPTSTDPRVPITGKGAGPILVMGTTGDAATPLSSTRAMAEALEDGRLVIVTGNQHTGYGLNECADSTIHEYLIDPENHAPDDGTECP